jgi:hypothetical protein
LKVTISGFAATSDVVDLTAIGTDGTIAGQSSTHLTIAGSGGTVTFTLDASDGTSFSTTSDGASGTDVAMACFCRGTMILTPDGEVGREIGDRRQRDDLIGRGAEGPLDRAAGL